MRYHEATTYLYGWILTRARGSGRRKSKGIPVKKVLGAYGRDSLNDKWERLLSFAYDHDLAMVNKLFTTPKNSISHTFNGRGLNCTN